MKTPREWSKLLIKELYKHANRDGCFECKQILRAMGLNPNKQLDEVMNPKP